MTRGKRVLITTYQSAFLRPGGGEAELFELAQALNSMGVVTDLYGASSLRVDAYDIILHFSVQGESFDFVKSLKAMGKTVIIWPNLWWAGMPDENDAKFVHRFMSLADEIIFKSEAEVENVGSHVPLGDIRYSIIPWEVSQKYTEKTSDKLFKSVYGLEQYCLWVGVIERNKNQHLAIEVFKSIEVPLVFVGFHRDEEYFQYCRSNADSSILFLPYMEPGSEILRSAYKGCSLYVELSDDPAGKSALEAALYEKPMLLSDNSWSREEFGESVYLVDPRDIDQVRIACIDGLKGRHRFRDSQRIKGAHLDVYTVSKIIGVIEKHCQEKV